MKLAVDEAIEIEMDPWSIEQAQKHLDEISLKYRKTNSNELNMGRFDQIMQAMFTILFFAQMEKQNPGVLQRLMGDAERIAKAMSKPEPEKEI